MSKLTYSGQKYFYAVVGAGELLVEKTRELTQKGIKVADARRKDAVKLYDEMAERGEKLTGKVKKSRPGKRVAEQPRSTAKKAS